MNPKRKTIAIDRENNKWKQNHPRVELVWLKRWRSALRTTNTARPHSRRRRGPVVAPRAQQGEGAARLRAAPARARRGRLSIFD